MDRVCQFFVLIVCVFSLVSSLEVRRSHVRGTACDRNCHETRQEREVEESVLERRDVIQDDHIQRGDLRVEKSGDVQSLLNELKNLDKNGSENFTSANIGYNTTETDVSKLLNDLKSLDRQEPLVNATTRNGTKRSLDALLGQLKESDAPREGDVVLEEEETSPDTPDSGEIDEENSSEPDAASSSQVNNLLGELNFKRRAAPIKEEKEKNNSKKVKKVKEKKEKNEPRRSLDSLLGQLKKKDGPKNHRQTLDTTQIRTRPDNDRKSRVNNRLGELDGQPRASQPRVSRPRASQPRAGQPRVSPPKPKPKTQEDVNNLLASLRRKRLANNSQAVFVQQPHFMTTAKPPSGSGSLRKKPAGSDFEETLILAHRQWRQREGVRPLRWDATLANKSQSAVRRCTKSRGWRQKVFVTAQKSASQKYAARLAVKSWMSARSKMNSPSMKRFGCAINSRCKKGVYVICNYANK